MEELGEVLTILSSNTGDERARHAGNPSGGRPKSGTRQSTALASLICATASLGMPMNPLRVAFDVGPLAGPRTGVGQAVAAMRDALGGTDDVELVEYITSFRSPSATGRPPVAAARRCSPIVCGASPTGRGSIASWAGPTSFTAPTTWSLQLASRSVVSVYDCWFLRHPSACRQGGASSRAGSATGDRARRHRSRQLGIDRGRDR